MRKPFLFRQNIEYSLQVDANSLEEAEAKQLATPLTDWGKAISTVEVEGGEQLYKCLKCNGNTAEKQRDIQGWDGYCSKCGMIAQSQVGEPV